jgi:predicted DCC family thiol-disulfide oxidoreductase YuxK
MQPIILFDGVCNLCHSAILWVIDHDPQAIFRFASLQSQAARQALENFSPAELPDSIVLIDEDGIHTQSAAAIRIARRLGFPYSFLAIGLVLPTAWRDAIYAWVARNRYSWFGKQDTCLMPSPDLAQRFLDADEQIDVPETNSPATINGFGWWQCFLYAYLLIYIFPFPLADLPGIDAAFRSYGDLWTRAIQWFGSNVVGVDASILPNGSGDTTFNYVETLVDLLLAAAGATIWKVSGRWQTPLVKDLVTTSARYFLAAMMLTYGWGKLIPVQMPEPGPDRLISSFADTSPMGLLWTFMGASKPYQMLCGFLEVLGGALLLFRRTTLSGALLSAVAMSQVLALNLCFDVPVKLLSSHLVLFALFLLAPHMPRLFSFLLGLPAKPLPADPMPLVGRWPKRSRVVIKSVLVVLFLCVPSVMSYLQLKETLQQDKGPLHGLYSAEPSRNLNAESWVRVGISGGYQRIGIQRRDGSTKRYRYEIDQSKQQLKLTFGAPGAAGKQPVEEMTFQYSQPNPEELRLSGPFQVVLKKLPEQRSLLLNRGFHWVNEFPYNR